MDIGGLMPKVLNKRIDQIPEGAVYVGRPSIRGNPYKVGLHGTQDKVVRKYRSGLREDDIRKIRKELRGKDLVCWCAPEACHADVLLKLANEDVSSEIANA